MKRPARVAACSRGGVINGCVKSDIPASWFAALTSVMADQAMFAYFITDELHGIISLRDKKSVLVKINK